MALCGLQKDVTISQRHVICDLSQPRTDHSTNESENFLLKIHVDVGKFVLFPQLSHRGCTIRGGGGAGCPGEPAPREDEGKQAPGESPPSIPGLPQETHSSAERPLVWSLLAVGTYMEQIIPNKGGGTFQPRACSGPPKAH